MQEPESDPEGLPLDNSGKPRPRYNSLPALYLQRLFNPRLSPGVQAEWVRLAKLVGWEKTKEAGMKYDLCDIAVYFTLLNYGVRSSHPLYKELYDRDLIAAIHGHVVSKRAVSSELVQKFREKWLGRAGSPGSATDRCTEQDWEPGSEPELDHSSFEQIVTKYLLVSRLLALRCCVGLLLTGLQMRLNQSGPEDWENKPPPSPTRAASSLSDGTSEFQPNEDISPSSSNSMILGESSITGRRSATVPLSVGATAGEQPGVDIRRGVSGHIKWEASTVNGQPIDEWLVEQRNKERTLKDMSVAVGIRADRLGSRVKKLVLKEGQKPT